MHPAIRTIVSIAIVASAVYGFAASECPTISTGSLGNNPHPDEAQLVEMVNAVLLAHCTCEFPDSLAQHLSNGIEYGFDSVESFFGGPPACLGTFEIRAIEMDSEHPIGAIDVRTTVEPILDYFIIVFLTDEGWYCYWPEQLQESIQ